MFCCAACSSSSTGCSAKQKTATENGRDRNVCSFGTGCFFVVVCDVFATLSGDGMLAVPVQGMIKLYVHLPRLLQVVNTDRVLRLKEQMNDVFCC